MDICPFCGSQQVKFNTKQKVYCCLDCWEDFDAPLQKADRLNLFFSYGHDKNKPLVEKIKAYLESRGHTVWIDDSQIKAGDNWRRRITTGIRQSDEVVAFLSKHSVREPGVCRDELKIALCIHCRPVKTVLTEKEAEVSPPSSLCEVQWLDMSNWQQVAQQGDEVFEKWFDACMQALCKTLESDENITLNGEIKQLQTALQPKLSYSKEFALIEKPLYGRKWLTEAIGKWCDDRNAGRVLLIEGTAGTGKSAFAAHSLHYNDRIAAGMFFEWNLVESYTPEVFVRTLAFKLALRLLDYRSHLLSALTKVRLEKMHARDLLECLIVEPLSKCIDGNRDAVVLLLDGLDEIGEAGKQLPVLLASVVHRLPAWIRLLITSRPEEDLIAPFGKISVIRLTNDPFGDVANYIRDRLHGTWNEADQSALVHRCEGSFLYAEALCDAAQTGELSASQLQTLPAGISGFYYLNFNRAFASAGDYARYRQVLELLCVEGSIPRRVIQEALQLDDYSFVEHMRPLRSVTVVEYPQQSRKKTASDDDQALIKFHHKSIGEWLCDPNRSGSYYVDQRKGRQKLIDFCTKKLYSYMDAPQKRFRDRAYLFAYGHLPKWLVADGEFDQYAKLLMSKEQERGRLWKVTQFNDPYYRSNEAYDYSLWRYISQFPEDYDMTALHDVFHHSLGLFRMLLSNATYSCVQVYYNLFSMFLGQLHQEFMWEEWLYAVRNVMLPAFLRSAASETYHYSGLPYMFNADKLRAAQCLYLLLDECRELKAELPGDVQTTIHEFLLSAMFCEGNVGDLETIYMNFKNLFRNRIIPYEIPENAFQHKRLVQCKQEFHTICLADHLRYGKSQDPAYIQQLLLHGADMEAAQAMKI